MFICVQLISCFLGYSANLQREKHGSIWAFDPAHKWEGANSYRKNLADDREVQGSKNLPREGEMDLKCHPELLPLPRSQILHFQTEWLAFPSKEAGGVYQGRETPKITA